METKWDRRQTNFPPKPLHPKLLYFQQFNVDLTANKNNEHELFQENKNLKCSENDMEPLFRLNDWFPEEGMGWIKGACGCNKGLLVPGG